MVNFNFTFIPKTKTEKEITSCLVEVQGVYMYHDRFYVDDMNKFKYFNGKCQYNILAFTSPPFYLHIHVSFWVSLLSMLRFMCVFLCHIIYKSV